MTRLVSRQGRAALTGIDRVEVAYLDRFLRDPVPLFALVRTRIGFLLLDRRGAAAALALARGEIPPPPPDVLSRLTRRGAPARAGAETALRRLAVARAAPPLLARMLRRRLPAGCACFLVGHSDLTHRVLGAMRQAPGASVTVLVHDTIPLERPDLCRPGSAQRLRAGLGAVSRHATRVVCTTQDAAGRAAAHLAAQGRVPPVTVAPLGIDRTPPDAAALPPGLPPDRPFLLCLGTIEPRKNHALLLDLWERMHATVPEPEIPTLVLAGARGWDDGALFRRLDRLPFVGRTVLECPGLGDGAVAALMARARALLFPSLAEGFGLPPVEALAAGLRVIAAPLPALRETLGDAAQFIPVTDHDTWMAAVLAAAASADRPLPRPVPGWDDHFNLVLSPG